MLSKDLMRLHGIFCAWTDGTMPVTADQWHEFRQSLHSCVVQAKMLELGVDISVIDVLTQCAEPGSVVVPFPRNRIRRVIDGGVL